jgi:hypothetical protein
MSVDSRVQKAIELIKTAQRLVRHAAEVLYEEPGCDDDWNIVCGLRDSTRHEFESVSDYLERSRQIAQAREAEGGLMVGS